MAKIYKLPYQPSKKELKRAAKRKAKRQEARVKLARKLVALPPEYALHAIREAVNQDYELIWVEEISQWCARHYKMVAALTREGNNDH